MFMDDDDLNALTTIDSSVCEKNCEKHGHLPAHPAMAPKKDKVKKEMGKLPAPASGSHRGETPSHRGETPSHRGDSPSKKDRSSRGKNVGA